MKFGTTFTFRCIIKTDTGTQSMTEVFDDVSEAVKMYDSFDSDFVKRRIILIELYVTGDHQRLLLKQRIRRDEDGR